MTRFTYHKNFNNREKDIQIFLLPNCHTCIVLKFMNNIFIFK